MEMLSVNTQLLRILGKVENEILDKLNKSLIVSDQEKWFFIDYSSSAIALDTQFEYSSGAETYFIRILECIDPYGRNLPEISEGDKTICKLSFQPAIPLEIENLPDLEIWTYNPSSIELSAITSVTLDLNNDLVNNFLSVSYDTFRNNIDTSSNTITLFELLESFQQVFHLDKNDARIIYSLFIRTGKIKPILNNKVELLPIAM